MKGFALARILCLSLLCGHASLFSQVIQPYFFGQNAWMPDTIGNPAACAHSPCYLNGKLHRLWTAVAASGAQCIRFGGISPDRNRPTDFQYIKMIDSIRAKGMEPVMQVPFNNGAYTAAQAAAIVQYINITKGKNVKYWIIGNEPDLSYSYTSASQVAAYFKSFASAMKAVDPGILTIGPECAWYNSSIINGLTTPGGANDITGRDAAGRFYVDIVSFHTYPFNGSQTRDQVITKIHQPGGLSDNLATLNSRLAACNSFHNRVGSAALTAAVTEANINWQNSANDNLYGLGVNSFIGGQFIAEMLGAGMKHGLSMMNIWSVVEGNGVALNIGYIDPANYRRKPAYYHYRLLADNFSGSYVNGVTTFTNVKAFGSKSAQEINVLLMNQDAVNNHTYTVRLNTTAISNSVALRININAAVAASYTDVIGSQSTELLTFDIYGNLIRKQVYSLSGHAVNDLAPSLIMINGALPVGLSLFEATPAHEQEVLLRWITQTEKNNAGFEVQRSLNGRDFTGLAFIPGAGTSQAPQVYRYSDVLPGDGIYYYRLAQHDLDGSVNYSDLRAVKAGDDFPSSLVVYPNPTADGNFYLKLKAPPLLALKLEVLDVCARSVFTQSLRAGDDGHLHSLLYAGLLPGLYTVRLSSETSVYNARLIVK